MSRAKLSVENPHSIISIKIEYYLIKIYGKEIRLTSEAYEKMGVGIVCDTNEGEETYIKYINLIDDAKLIETISGRKNLPCE